MCTVPLPQGVYPIAVDKYINQKVLPVRSIRKSKQATVLQMQHSCLLNCPTVTDAVRLRNRKK